MSNNRQGEIKTSATIGMSVNIILFIAKFIISIISGSVSILSDAFNNLSDLFSSIITLVSAYLTQKPADENHPYGHGRVEYIATQLVSFFIIYVGITLLIESIKQILNPQPLEVSSWIYLVLILSILLKGWMMLKNQKIKKKIDSDLIEAVVVDSRNDVISSVVLLIAMLIQPKTSLPIDGMVGTLLSILILYQGYEILRNSISKLLGKKISDETIKVIDKIINSDPNVLGYHNFKGHDYGPNHIHVSVDLELPDTTDLNTAHRIVDSIEREIYQAVKVDVVAHIDPISSDEELNQRMYQEVLELTSDLFNPTVIEKFSCVKGHHRTSIFLTLNLPNEQEYNRIRNQLVQRAKQHKEELSFHFELRNTGESNE